MSRPGPTLWRGFKALLWLLFRLVVYALTGSWIGSRTEDGGGLEPVAGQGAGMGSETGVPGVPGSAPHPVSLPEWVATLQQRLAAVGDGAGQLGRAGNLPRAVEALAGELAECGAQADTPNFAVVARLQGAELAVGFVERALRQRARGASTQAWLAALDRLADDLVAPVMEELDAHRHGRPLRVWVSAQGRLGEEQQHALLSTPVGALPVERDLERRPGHWPSVVPRVARGLLVDVPGLRDELVRRHGLPEAVPLPHAHLGIGPDEVHGALGVWLETLFTDVYACLRLGPAYAHHLLHVFDDGSPSQRAHAATALAGWLSPLPPRSVRIHTVVRVLEVLGQHREAKAVWEAWTGAHGEVDMLFFPTADGTWNAIPAAYFFAQLEPLLASLTTEPLDSLDQTALCDVPDLEFGHADDANHQRLRRLFAAGREEAHAPYLALAAAVRAVVEDGADPAVVAAAAQRALGVPAAVAAQKSPAGPRAGTAAASAAGRERLLPLRQAVRSRQIQREAIVLAAALARGGRRSMRPRRSRA